MKNRLRIDPYGQKFSVHVDKGGKFMKVVFLFIIALTLALGGETHFNGSFEVCAYLANEPENGLTGQVTVGDLISYAYRKNPSIVAAREGWKAVVEDYRLTTGYPDPELNLIYYPEPIESRLGPLDWSASLNQKIPFPSKLTQAGKMVEAEARVAHIKLDRTVKGVIASVWVS